MKKRRPSLRLPGYDYSAQGGYFVTMVLEHRMHLFGRVIAGEMVLSPEGTIVWDCWSSLPQHYPGVRLDEFVVMPDHVHGIILIEVADRRPGPSPAVGPAIHELRDTSRGRGGGQGTRLDRRRMTLPKLVGRFKQNSAKQINLLHGTPGRRIWADYYWERIIRDHRELDRIRHYIRMNPKNWRHR